MRAVVSSARPARSIPPRRIGVRPPRVKKAVLVVFFALPILLALIALPAGADQADTRLDGLFVRLQETADPLEGEVITQRIWELWSAHENERARSLLGLARQAMARHDFEEALARLDLLVRIEPKFAEAWNARATLYFIMGAYDASIADVRRTLALEPRHFGAISGLGQILAAQGRDAEAIGAFERALEVNPHMAGPRISIERLRERLEGKQI